MRTAGAVAILLLLLGCTVRNDTVTNEANGVQGGKTSNWVVVEEPPPPPSAAELQKCLIQGGEQLRVLPVKAIGTEPFWSAEVDGRCVIYKTPEDQGGARYWTHVDIGPTGTVWTGLGSRRFQLMVRPKPDCSDGMSDKVYPLEAILQVGGEVRRGCAEGR